MKNQVSFIVLLMFTSIQVFAADITWDGSEDNDWHNGDNWIGDSKPGVGDYAIINGGAFIVDISTTEIIQGVRVINATLNITGTGNLSCSAAASPGIWGQGNVNNMGIISITSISHAGIQLENKTFINNGTLTIDGTSQTGITMIGTAVFDNTATATISNATGHGIQLQAASTFNNNGSLVIGNSGTITGRGIFNSGIFNASSGSMTVSNTNDAAIQNHGGSFINGSSLTVDKGNFNSKAIVASSGGSFVNSGTLNGIGAIHGANGSFSNTGTVAPGFSPGSQTYQDGFNNAGTFEFELETTSNFDNLVFNGASSADFIVGGIIDVTLINGYSPVINDEFKIIVATVPVGYIGTFATVNYTNSNSAFWRTDYNATDITLRYAGVVAPISLVDFEAKADRKNITLKWSTAIEVNNEGFELQKSVDGKLWKKLGWVSGQNGNSSTTQEYEFIDKKPSIGINYYKMIQIDLDGTRTEYQTVMAEFIDVDFAFNTYPNPVRGILNIETAGNNVNRLNIYNISGEMVKTIEANSSVIDMSDLSSGQYWIEAISGSQKSIKKIVKR